MTVMHTSKSTESAQKPQFRYIMYHKLFSGCSNKRVCMPSIPQTWLDLRGNEGV